MNLNEKLIIILYISVLTFTFIVGFNNSEPEYYYIKFNDGFIRECNIIDFTGGQLSNIICKDNIVYSRISNYTWLNDNLEPYCPDFGKAYVIHATVNNQNCINIIRQEGVNLQ